VEWLIVKALNSNPSTLKKKEKEQKDDPSFSYNRELTLFEEKNQKNRIQWLKPVILPIQEMENERITVQGQPWQKLKIKGDGWRYSSVAECLPNIYKALS
jgi:hypothetical protein